MPAPALILKAYKVKRALERLRRAKYNGFRIHRGLRPKYPCYEECWNWMVGCLKKTICRAFCPCCIYRPGRDMGKPEYSGSFLSRLCIGGTFENNMVKSFLGFFGGVILTFMSFIFLLHQLNCDPRAVTIFCCIQGLILTLGLAFSDEVRCVVLLILPELFSSRGRIALMAYTYILVMSGPAKNAMRNANILINSMSCGQELIVNQTKAILRSVFAPLVAIIDTMRSVLEALKDFARQMKAAFLAIKDLFLEIIAAIKRMFSWLLSIVKVCSNKYGSPYERCMKAFNDAIADCRVKLGVFDFLCEIVKLVRWVCELARIVDLLCEIPRAIKKAIIDPLKAKVKQFTTYMYNQFYVNITLTHFYNYSLEQSKTFKEIRGDIATEVKNRTKWFTSLIDWSDFTMSFFLLMVVFRALMYRIRYMTADHFDNFYITFLVRDIDDKRVGQEKETILPLTFREKRKYVNTFSIRMGKSERRRLVTAFTVLFISGCQMAFYMLIDYGLYWLLKMIRYHGKVQAKGQVPTHVQMHVKGDGVLADMYRQMITSFDPVMGVVPDIDTTNCLPNPVPIDEDRYQQIGIMYGICILLALTEAYGLRMRHVICACYYPAREKFRAIWLYNHILKTRGGLLKFLRRKIRRKFYGDDTIEDISFLDRLCNQYRLFGRFMTAFGFVKKYCLSCNEPGAVDDMDNFKHCNTPGCKAIYCIGCFDDINNLCTVCMKPVDYGDLSDVSEERDSSEEEELRMLRESQEEEEQRSLQESSQEEGDEELESIRESEDDDEEEESEDYDYQYEDRRESDSEEEEQKPWRDVEAQKKRELVTVDILEEDEEEERPSRDSSDEESSH